MSQVKKSVGRLFSTAQGVVGASMSVNVLIAVALCALLSQGVLFDYSNNDVVFPQILPEYNFRRLVTAPYVKKAVLFALVLGVLNYGVWNVVNNTLKSLMVY